MGLEVPSYPFHLWHLESQRHLLFLEALVILVVPQDQVSQGSLDCLSPQGVLEHQTQEALGPPSLLVFQASQVDLLVQESLVALVVPEHLFLEAQEVPLIQVVHLAQHHLLVLVAHLSQCVLEDLEVLGNLDLLLDQRFLLNLGVLEAQVAQVAQILVLPSVLECLVAQEGLLGPFSQVSQVVLEVLEFQENLWDQVVQEARFQGYLVLLCYLAFLASLGGLGDQDHLENLLHHLSQGYQVGQACRAGL